MTLLQELETIVGEGFHGCLIKREKALARVRAFVDKLGEENMRKEFEKRAVKYGAFKTIAEHDAAALAWHAALAMVRGMI